MSSIVSWSGGKDACLALYRSQADRQVSGLLSALDETGLKAHARCQPRLVAGPGLGCAVQFFQFRLDRLRIEVHPVFAGRLCA